MITVFYISAVVVAIGVMMWSWGHNLTIPYYSRHLLLAGRSFESQWAQRALIGEVLIKAGICVIVTAVLIGFGFIGILVANDYRYYAPETVEVYQTNNHTLLIVNGVDYKVDKNIYYWIDDTYPGMTMRNRHNMYGWEIYSGEFVLVDTLPEEDERFLEADDGD